MNRNLILLGYIEHEVSTPRGSPFQYQLCPSRNSPNQISPIPSEKEEGGWGGMEEGRKGEASWDVATQKCEKV